MANEQVGTGYVLIKPKMDESAKSKLESSGKTSGQGFGTAFQVAAGNLIASAVTGLASFAADTFSNAFSNYANYEQLVGGIETLFKESAGIVQQNAAAAFETAGLSTNEYMEQVTSFSASLLQGLGGDTEKAAAYADMAIRDMSDNANKMGSDMQSITNAYQGFAKQNYTMLDNLKLGYGGTKTEMERLLADASKIAGVEFNIDNYNDVIEAIHVMQESMDIAGTTSKEATGTISGSIAKLRSSWQNFLTGVFDDKANLGALGEKLFNSIGDVLGNVVPRLGVLASRLFGEDMGEAITEAVTETFDEVSGIIGSAIEAIEYILKGVVDFLTSYVWPIIQGAIDIVTPVVEDITALIEKDMPAIRNIIDTAMKAVKAVMDFVWPVVGTLVKNIMTDIRNFVKAAWSVIENVTNAAATAIDTAIRGLQPIVEFVKTLFDGVKAAIENPLGLAQTAVQTVATAISGIFGGMDTIKETVGGIFDGIKNAIETPMNMAKDAVGGIIEAIKGFFNFSVSWPHIPLPHPYISPAGWGIDDLLKGVIPSIGVEWYSKGGIVDGATLIGAGEAGPELILPQSGATMDAFAESVARRVGGGITVQNMTVVTDSPEDFMRQLTAFAKRTRAQYA